MGLFDQITGALGQQSGLGQHSGEGAQHTGGMQMILALISSYPGGVQGLIQKLMAGGLAEHVQSWIGKGGNLPVSAEQIQSVLGSGTLAALAKQFGVSETAAAESVSQALPTVVDQVTPNGAVEDDLLQQGPGLLKGKLFG
ncbi:MAG: YidB family protein [Betaproteobacteria bacterium]